MNKLPFIFLFFPLISFCQEKKDTKIIVTAQDTTQLFRRVALALIDKNYSLIEKDNDLKFITTSAKPLKNIVASSRIKALVQGSTIIFTALIRWDYVRRGQYGTFDPVEYVPNKGLNKGGATSVIWGEMMSLAQKFGNDITYAK